MRSRRRRSTRKGWGMEIDRDLRSLGRRAGEEVDRGGGGRGGGGGGGGGGMTRRKRRRRRNKHRGKWGPPPSLVPPSPSAQTSSDLVYPFLT
eukprot:2857464-Pyramimonas_sp.AAC.1